MAALLTTLPIKSGATRKSVMLCLKKEDSLENALFDAPGRGRSAEITDDETAWIINTACQKPVDNKYPKGEKIRIVLDNLKVHTSEETRKYLGTVPGRFEFVFTPKHGSWLNMVEGFFSKMTKQMLRGIRVKSKAELADRIYLYFNEINAEPVVFH